MKPFPHRVVDGFLDPALARALAAEFPPGAARLARDRFGRPAKATWYDFAALGPAFRRLDALTRSRAFLRRLEGLSGIEGLSRGPGGFGGAAHEYPSGLGVRPHLDLNLVPGTGLHRRLDVFLFLAPGWRPSWGGELALGDRARGQATKAVVPAFNRAVLLPTSESSWYGVRPATEPGARRRSVSLYYYASRPAVPGAAPRSTLWNFPALPRAAAAGARLDERLWTAIEDCFVLRELELRHAEPAPRRPSRSPLSPRLKKGAVLTAADAAWLRSALAERDRALKRKWFSWDDLLDQAVARRAGR